MADDSVDISGMPAPPQGYAEQQSDPTAEMPSPEDQYRKFYFGGGLPNANGKFGPIEPIPKDALDQFTANPPSSSVSANLKHGASALTGLPRVAADFNPVTPVVAAVAGGAGALTGTAGAIAHNILGHPELASEDLATGRQRLRDWSSGVYKLAEYLPSKIATARGNEAADTLLSMPQGIGKNINDNMVRPWAGDNVADTLGDIGSDVATELPGFGAKGVALKGVSAVKAAAKAGADFIKSERASLTPPEPTGDFTTPPVGKPVTGNDLRAAPNPIPPPDGTVAAERQKAATASPNGTGTMPFGHESNPVTPAPVAPAEPVDMSLPPEQRAIQREGVAAQRDRADPNQPPTGPQLAAQPAKAPLSAMRPGQRGTVRVMNAPGEESALDALGRLIPGARIFTSPKDEGPQETPSPERQTQNAANLEAIDKLSGGQLPSRRTSAITGDYNATGNDWQAAKTGNEAAQRQLASESDALHAATDNVHKSTGTLSDDSVDPTTLEERGRTTRGAIQAIEKHFDDATDSIYDTARSQNQGRPIPKLQRVSDYLNDDSNFTNDAEIGLQRAAKQRMERLWTTGDPDKGTPPGSVNAAERMREFLNEKGRNPNAMGVAKDLKNHLDMDVAEHGGPGLFQAARAMRRHSAQMLEEPTGIKKLLAPSDSQGINHAIPEHKVMDYIADLSREQHEHVMNVLRAGAHLSPEIAESSAAAIREIQAHTISRLHDAATNDGGKWNARDFYNASSRYARNAASTFKDRPDILRNLKTINDAGNTLHMDKSYPGAVGQAARSGVLTGAVKGAGAVASSLAHEIPVIGRIVGRGIEGATEAATGDIGKKAAEKAFEKRTVDRTGKQRGSIQVIPAKSIEGQNGVSDESVNRFKSDQLAGRTTHIIDPDGNHEQLTNPTDVDLPAPKGSVKFQKGVGILDRGGLPPTQASGLVARAQGLHGFDPKQRGSVRVMNDTVPEERTGSMLNVGLHQGQEGQPGFRSMSKQEAQGAVESTGAKVTKSSVLTPEAHGVPEPTAVLSTNRPLAEPEMQKVLAKTKQSAITQRTDAGVESMHVAPGHEEIAKEQGWDKFNPDYFRDHEGKINVPSGQRGSVRVMNEKPLAGAPDGDKPNGKARGAAAAYKRSAGIDTPPLKDYRFIDPKVAKNVADAYEEMKHDPTNPKVAKSYDAFKAETLAQYKQMVKAGVEVDLDPSYPYKNPREMHSDVRYNNHMSVYPTEAGFGSEGAAPTDHPLMEKAPVKMGGKDATYNDLFRAVHDYYGHAAEGNGFRANGEYNAWRAHRQMYSPEARGAMDAETLGQNSWVNSGPAGALNKGASGADTIYADQKAGLLPRDVVKSAEEGVGADEHHITNQLTDKERAQLRTDTTKRLVDAFNSAPATKEYAAAALAGAAKRGWYKNSAQAIVNQFGPDAPRFAGLLSAMSPQVSVQTNFANALKTFVNWDKAGRPESPDEIRAIMEQSSQKSAKAAPGSSNVLDAWVNNSVRALTADDPTNIKLSGPKVHSFYNNLTDNVHEVTNDAWMSTFAKIDPAKLGGSLNQAGPGKSPSYLALSGKVREAARMISNLTGETWTPAEVQETVWSWAKTAYEHAEEKGSDVSIPDLVKKGAITDELIRSTPDFHQLFSTSEHRGLLQSSSFAANADRMAEWKSQGADTASSSKAREAAAKALRPALISAAERLEQVRQERRAAGKSAPKDEE